MNSDEKVSKIVSFLGMFALKRPDIGYHYGMTYMIGLLLSIFSSENEVFLLFCYIIEMIFPSDFFLSDNRCLGLHKELRNIAKMAEILRPNLINTLKAVFKPTGSNKKETDMTPFLLFIKRTSETWIKSLFVPYLTLEDTYRVWDSIFIHGFDFIIKFTLTMFSKHENFIKNTVKQETKILGLGISVDSLIIAGNLSRIKLLRKLEKLPIEKMIKKSMTKNTYVIIKRADYLLNSTELEKNNIDRLVRLRQTKSVIRSKTFSYEDVINMFTTINSISSQDQISRGLFLSIANNELNWTGDLASNIFTTFDQKGADIIPSKHLKLGLSIISNCELEEKLNLAFYSNATKALESISADALCETLVSLEEVLDHRNKFLKNNILAFKQAFLMKNYSWIKLEEFVLTLSTDNFCEVIIKLITAIESSDALSSIELNIANIVAEGIYSDTHSPMRVSSISTPKSEISYEGPDLDELSNKLNKIAMTYNQYVENDPVTVVFDIEESECEGNL